MSERPPGLERSQALYRRLLLLYPRPVETGRGGLLLPGSTS